MTSFRRGDRRQSAYAATAATPAGKLDRRITFARATVADDGYGGEIETWAPLGKRWAMVRYGTGRERREAAQTSATISATFRVRRDSLTRAVTPKDRIEFDGGIWNIVGAPVETPAHDMMDVTAVRAA